MELLQPMLEAIRHEVEPVMERLDPHALDRAVQSICQARHIFVAGMGRSGYMMRAFAMRLMQMGLLVYMVGDTNTPCAQEGDLLVLGSGSGETESLKNYAAKAHRLGVETLVITGHPESTLGRAADVLVALPVNEEAHKDETGAMIVYRRENGGERMLLGSRVELCLLLVCELLTMLAFRRLGVEEADMMRRHACFE